MWLSHWSHAASALLTAAGLCVLFPGWTLADVQPGDTITKENMDKAGDLLIPGVQWFVQNGMPIKVAPTKKVEWPTLYREATEKYSSQVQLSADGREIFNYVAGAPFPNIDANDPLAGAKIMWNQEQKPAYTDNVGSEWLMETVTAQGARERTYQSAFWRRMMWTGRLYLDPKPVVRSNPPLRYTEQLGPLFEPFDLKGAGVLSNRYMAAAVPDDTYLYLPELRRVRRIGVEDRGDALWGADVDLDSLWGFNAKVSLWQFRLLAEKEILASLHAGQYGDHSIWCAPSDGTHGVRAFMPCNINWEKRPVWVVEGLPTAYSQYAFSKRILYVDQDTLSVLFTESFDQEEEPWRLFFNIFNYTKTPYEGYPARPLEGGQYNYEDEQAFTPYGLMADLQTAHGSVWDAPSGYVQPEDWLAEWYFNEAVPINTKDIYTTNSLMKSAR
jgi:uncharacterized protein DUF1329